MGADEAIVYSITVAVALFGLGVAALLAIWLPHFVRLLLDHHRNSRRQ